MQIVRNNYSTCEPFATEFGVEPNPLFGVAGLGLRLRGLLTKDEAFHEALRRWRKLPEEDRQTISQAQVFAAGLADALDFRTMGNERKVIEAWLVRDLGETKEAAE